MSSEAGWMEVSSKYEAKEWRKRVGGLTLVVWQSDYDVPRDNFQALVMIGRSDSVDGRPDLPTFKAATRECERLLKVIAKHARSAT